MNESQLSIPVDMDREEVGHLFENYNLNSACVVDKNNKLVGMITSDDILTVLKEEAEEDALRLLVQVMKKLQMDTSKKQKEDLLGFYLIYLLR